jgi:diadenosine tetraphosphate (Ap4A) HIT family hydrolase
MSAIHRMVAQCQAGKYPRAVARLPSGWLVLGERQVLLGYCLLLPDPVVGDLNALNGAERRQFLADMAMAGDVLIEELGASHINYAMFGNVEPALHAHLFPRHRSEPEATRTVEPFALDWTSAPAYSGAIHAPLGTRIAAAIHRRR